MFDSFMGENENGYANSGFGGAAGGAMAGSAFGPWGALIGGGVGLGAGLAGAYDQQQRRQALRKQYEGRARTNAAMMNQMAASRGLQGGAAAGAQSQAYNRSMAPMARMDNQMGQQQQGDMMGSLMSLAMFYAMMRNGGGGMMMNRGGGAAAAQGTPPAGGG